MKLLRHSLLLATILFMTHISFAQAQHEHVPASSIPTADLIQPADFAAALQSSAPKPLILQTGSHVLFAQAHIPGSEYAGPAGQSAGIDAIKARVASLPKSTAIVLYCGCCPWGRCPNIAPAYNLLHEQGFTNVKVLYLAENFGTDWVNKGYPTEKGR
ncbi:rhodanese-like domain-containing protein [Edaphobacter flagellatus]|uniref:rhodanese-like domain-containing protein n=1 Tax=Edaphobacter flagellatus TaxID=1933044 RepID=UPI0021B335C5|nr:rhodanese-like domain-containing protein [Edaphobacter flagellatus]